MARSSPRAPSPSAQGAGGRRRALWWAPNALTLTRLALAPVVLGCLVIAWRTHAAHGGGESASGAAWTTAAGAVFLLAGLLDFADGRLARALGVESRFGEFWDPVADKAVIGAALLGLAAANPALAPAAALIVLRDVAVTVMRTTPAGAAVRAPSRLAKAKTALGFVGVGAALLAHAPVALAGATPAAETSRAALGVAGAVLIHITAALSVWTALGYARGAGRATPTNAHVESRGPD